MDFPVAFAASNAIFAAQLQTSDQGFTADFGTEKQFAVAFDKPPAAVAVAMSTTGKAFAVNMDTGGDWPAYDGEYEVTPKIEAQKLNTANRSMEKDVTIHAIPYYEVDNASNGQTIIIGGN